MWHTSNSTGIEPVQIEPNGHGGAHVWLRINIEQTTDEDGNPKWDADETYGMAYPVPTVEEIEADFAGWWGRLEEKAKTTAQRIAELEEVKAIHEAAILELAELLGGE